MNTILMCGSETGNETLNVLFSAIRYVHHGAFHLSGDAFSIIPPKSKNADFLIIDTTSIKNIHTPGGIALFRKHVPRKNEIEVPPSFFAVIDSDNHEAANMLRENGIQTISCGLSPKDTVTFSSLDNDRAVVSLQRGLKSLDGGDLMPAEVPVSFGPSHSEYPVLAAVAVLLLSNVPIPDGGLALA